MAPTPLVVQALPGPFDLVEPTSLNILVSDPDTVNGNSFRCTGRELVLIVNTTGSSLSVEVTSTEDTFQRISDIIDYEVPTDIPVVLTVGLTNARGWKQTDGFILLNVTGNGGKIAVIRLP